MDDQVTSSAEHEKFNALLHYLKRTRGFDFSGYKRSSLMRRIRKRMQSLQISDFVDYIDYLEVHPDEFALLFNHLLINVSGFFRDEPAWEFLQREIVPAIIARKKPGEPIRVWSAGCASGQEPYSLAIAFAEALGPEAFRERVKIYASDIDEHALAEARQAAYSARELQVLDPRLRSKYFEPSGSLYVFRSDLRRAVIFGRHDLVTDAPISRLDLLCCRNTLMYFNAETQGRLLARFHFALNEPGYLFLGKAEMLLTHADLFEPVALKYRIFRKVSRAGVQDRLQVLDEGQNEELVSRVGRQSRLRERAFNVAPVAQLVVDVGGYLVLANEQARSLFGLSTQDLNRPFRDLEVSYRPIELRSLLEQAYSECRPLQIPSVERRLPSGGTQTFEVTIVPLLDQNSLLGASISFLDISQAQELRMELQRSNQELETAYEELQSTNEELETTNEELQSTVEELETTNEELQSTNEELETMNEELQSTNEELQTVNSELRDRTEELNRTNRFLEMILSSLRGGVVVLDEQLRILIWNRHMEELWGLRADEVRGRSFMSLDIGLPVEQLMGAIRACLNEGKDQTVTEVQAINRRGKPIICRVTCSPLAPLGEGGTRGAILLVEDRDPETSHSNS